MVSSLRFSPRLITVCPSPKRPFTLEFLVQCRSSALMAQNSPGVQRWGSGTEPWESVQGCERRGLGGA